MNNNNKPKVTIYIPCHNYGRFLTQAVDSVLEQTYSNWELLIIDDGSKDETTQVCKQYNSLYPYKIRLFRHETPQGLRSCANLAIDTALGDYIIRLDADDYLDENALLVMTSYMDNHPDIALVYPNYIYVSEQNEFMGIENRKKIGKETQLMDIPAHGACTMVRKRVLKSIGGYDENYNAQDGYELWLKVLHRYPIANISTPLFYYRQHESSLSTDNERILSARQNIYRGMAEKFEGKVKPRICAIIPAKNTYVKMPNIVLQEIAGQPLIDYTLNAAKESNIFETVFVTTDDPGVVDYCNQFPGIIGNLRPSHLSSPEARLSQVIFEAVQNMEEKYAIYPDILVLLTPHAPLRKPSHIIKTIDTLLLYNVDNVISVYEDRKVHYSHGPNGLELLNKGMLQRLRLEREALYVDNGTVHAFWRDIVKPASHYGIKIGHVVISREESYLIQEPSDIWLVEKLLEHNKVS